MYGVAVRASQHPASWVWHSIRVPGILEHDIWGILPGNVPEAELCSEVLAGRRVRGLESPSWHLSASFGSPRGSGEGGGRCLRSVFHALSRMTLARISEGYVRLGSHLVKNSSHADSSLQNSIQAKGTQMDQSWARTGKFPSWSSPLENRSRVSDGTSELPTGDLPRLSVWLQECGCYADAQRPRDHKDRN